jgi:hypothetical protein
VSLRKSLFFVLSFAVLLAFSVPVVAQSTVSGAVTGVVTDPSGAVIPGASVTLKSNETAQTKTATTNGQGVYRFGLVQPGSYTVTITAPNYAAATRIISVSLGQASTVNTQLALASAQQTVTVTAEGGTIQTENANVSTTFSTQQIQTVPNPGNDLSYVAQSSPGAVMNTQAGYGNFSTYGLPGTSNLFTYNGMNENDPFLNLNNSGATNLLLGNNDVREATVVNNGYSGQYGQLAGANVNYVSKSGSNAWHGNVKYWWNGTILNANNFFNKQSTPPVDRPAVNANQWAGSIGGPIRKDKTFFFVDQEGLYLKIPVIRTVNVPSLPFEAATLANVATANPAVVPFYQQMFSIYNHAPGAAAAQNVLSGGGCPGFTANAAFGASNPCALQFNSNTPNKTHEWLLSARVDQIIGNNDKLFLRFKTDHGVQATYTDPLDPIFNAVSTQPQYEGQLNETHTFGTNTVNQFVLSGSWYSAIFSTANLNATLQTLPYEVQFAGGAFRDLGHDLNIWPQGRNVTQYQIVDDVSHQMGNHDLKFGVNFHRNDVTDFDPGIGSVGDVFSESLNSFYSGVADNYIQNFPVRASQPVALYGLGLYLQDEWRVTNNLKLTLALRADHNSNPVCQTNCYARLTSNFSTVSHAPTIPYNQAILVGQHQALPSYPAVDWAPRFGFAYTPGGAGSNLVVRGGFGLFYDAFPATVADTFLNNPPLNNQFIVAGTTLAPAGTTGAGGIASAPTSAAAANAAFVSGFNAGLTAPQIAAIVPNGAFAPPSFANPSTGIRDPRYQEWNLMIEKGFGQKTSMQLNYVGNHGIYEAVQNAGVNAFCDIACFGPLGLGNSIGGFLGLPAAATDSRFGTLTEIQSGARSNYNGLTASLLRRFSSLQFQFNYTWSHALDEVSNAGILPFNFNTNTSVLTPQNPFNIRQYNYGNADYDIRNYFSANYTWDVPFKFHNGVESAALGGWTIGGTIFARTGTPFTAIDSTATGILGTENFGGSLNGTGAFIFSNWNNQGGTTCSSGAVNPNTPCYLGPSAPSGVANFTAAVNGFGAQRRNQIYGPHFFDTDLSVTKNFKIPGWESGRFGVGATFFNLFNHPNFDQPVQDVQNSSFGNILLNVSPPTSIYGSFLGADSSPRVIQLTAKIEF